MPSKKIRGAIKFTFEALEHLLDMEQNSILTIEVENQTQSITVIHNDKGRKTFEFSTGSTIPIEVPRLQYIARMPPRNKEE